MEYIRSLNQFQITVQVHSNLRDVYLLHQGHTWLGLWMIGCLMLAHYSEWGKPWVLLYIVLFYLQRPPQKETTYLVVSCSPPECCILCPSNVKTISAVFLSSALSARTRDQDLSPAQPLLHAAPISAVPCPQRLKAPGKTHQVSPPLVTRNVRPGPPNTLCWS